MPYEQVANRTYIHPNFRGTEVRRSHTLGLNLFIRQNDGQLIKAYSMWEVTRVAVLTGGLDVKARPLQ